MKKISIAVIFSILILSLPPAFYEAHAVPIKADIVFLIDNSASMGDDIAQVKARIIQFNDAMVANNIDAHYGLVRVGGGSPGAHFLQDIVPFATFNDGAGPFQNLVANAGNPESGSEGVNVAFANMNFRSGAAINLILLTDEDDDSTQQQFDDADQVLGANNALFNYIGVPGVGNTDSRYQVLADNHGGTGFNIIAFRNDPSGFFDNFVNTKVQEILEMASSVSGEFIAIDKAALLLAGAQSSVFSIVGVLSLVGALAVGAFYIKRKQNS